MGDADKYEIEVDRERRFAKLTLFGLWDRETLDRYARDVECAFEQAGAVDQPSDRLRTLIDLRHHGVQPRDVAAAIQDRLSQGVEQASRVAILVSPSALHKMQAQRLGSPIRPSLFAAEDEAMAWLFSALP